MEGFWAKSEIGKGTSFIFTLPMFKAEKKDLHFRFILGREFLRAQKAGVPLTLFLIEVMNGKDDEKNIFLGPLEEKVKQCLWRNSDITMKREHEKTLAAICEADLKGAQVIQERIKEKVLKPFEESFDPPPVTKLGVATYPEEALSEKELFRMAQERLRGQKMNKKKILVVDDEVDLVETLRFPLEMEGFNVLVSYNGEDALTQARKENPDLILLDLMLPKLDGYKVCRLLKFDERYKHIPILMLTAKTQEKDKLLGKETGANEYITKPFDIDELMKKVKAYLNK